MIGMSRMYQQELMDHYRNPRHSGMLSAPDFVGDDHNPSCGDRITISGKVSGAAVAQLGFKATGCVLSQASASILSEHCATKSVNEVLAFSKDEFLELVGIPLGPNRVKCCLLSLFALQEAIVAFQRRNTQ